MKDRSSGHMRNRAVVVMAGLLAMALSSAAIAGWDTGGIDRNFDRGYDTRGFDRRFDGNYDRNFDASFDRRLDRGHSPRNFDTRGWDLAPNSDRRPPP